jgi:hypothetical protein
MMSKGIWEKTIRLSSGGWLKVEVTGHPLDMAEDDRTFVEQVVDSIAEYEADVKKYGTAEAQAKPVEPETCERHIDCEAADREAQKTTGDSADHGPEVR